MAVAVFHLAVDELGHAGFHRAGSILVRRNQPIHGGLQEFPFRGIEIAWRVGGACRGCRATLWLRQGRATKQGDGGYGHHRLTQKFAT